MDILHVIPPEQIILEILRFRLGYKLENGSMRRIEKLEGGRLHIGEQLGDFDPVADTLVAVGGAFYVESIDDARVGGSLRKRYNVLTASDVGTRIEGVGTRVSDNIFWVED